MLVAHLAPTLLLSPWWAPSLWTSHTLSIHFLKSKSTFSSLSTSLSMSLSMSSTSDTSTTSSTFLLKGSVQSPVFPSTSILFPCPHSRWPAWAENKVRTIISVFKSKVKLLSKASAIISQWKVGLKEFLANWHHSEIKVPATCATGAASPWAFIRVQCNIFHSYVIINT